MLISIIIPSYNYEKYIAQSIESVINQTYSDWELIIVDDGSTDNSIEIINSFCQNDDRIKLFTHENCENKGLVQTLKLGISKAKGDWVAILESDDIWTSDCLEHRVNAILQNKNAKLFFNTVSLIGEENRIKNMQKVVDKTQKYLNKYSYPMNMYSDFCFDNQILTFSSVIIARAILLETEMNCPIDRLFDWWTYVHIGFENKFFYIAKPLTIWRVHHDSYINDKKLKPSLPIQLQAYWDIFKKNKTKKLFIKTFCIFVKFGFSIKFLKMLKCYVARYIKWKFNLR